jgi:hypothetical protein
MHLLVFININVLECFIVQSQNRIWQTSIIRAIHLASQQQEACITQHRFPTVLNNTKVSVLL